jgi:hypothetical protein
MKRALTLPKLALACGLTLGALGFAGSSEAKKCDPTIICPDIYAPVICSDGVVYPNQCYADRACATGCHPYNPTA